MSEERARILQMVSEGKIDAEEGARLLNALRSSSPASPVWCSRITQSVLTIVFTSLGFSARHNIPGQSVSLCLTNLNNKLASRVREILFH